MSLLRGDAETKDSELRDKSESGNRVGLGTEADQGQVEIGDQMHSPCFTCEIWRLASACVYGTSCLAFSSQLKRALCLHWTFLRGCAGLEGRMNLGSQRQQDSKEAQLQHQGIGSSRGQGRGRVGSQLGWFYHPPHPHSSSVFSSGLSLLLPVTP